MEEEISQLGQRISEIANTSDALERSPELQQEYENSIEAVQLAGYNVEVVTDDPENGPFEVIVTKVPDNQPDLRQGDWIRNPQQPLLPNGLKSPPRRHRDPVTPVRRSGRGGMTPRFQDFLQYQRTPYVSRTRETPQTRSSRSRYGGYAVQEGSSYQQNPQYLQFREAYSAIPQRSQQATADFNKWKTNMSVTDPTDRKILAIQNLVGELHSDMRRSDELLSYPRAQQFVTDRNAPFRSRGVPEPYAILPYQDYDGDNVPDTIIGRNNKIYSYNGYRPKDSDHALRQAFFIEHPEGPYKRKEITGITYDDDMHTPVAWNSDNYGYLKNVKPKVYKNVDRIMANRTANNYAGRHRSVFQILVMLVSEEIQSIKKFFKEHFEDFGIEISNTSGKTGVSAMTAIASAINEWMFLEPAFEKFNAQKPSGAREMTLERWQSKNKELRPLPFERTEIKKIIQDLFTLNTSPERIDNFKNIVRNTTIEQFKLRNPETADVIEAQQQAEI
jgi:hypothetical protein